MLDAAEARETFDWLERLYRWDEMGDHYPGISPLPPFPTAPIVLSQILRWPEAMCNAGANGTWVVRKYVGYKSTWGSEIGRVFMDAALTVAILGVAGALVIPAPIGGGERSVEGEPSIALIFCPVDHGSEVTAVSQSANGHCSDIPAEKIRGSLQSIRDQIGREALAYLAYRSLFGPHAGPSQFVAASPDTRQRRIAALCPELSAAELVRLLIRTNGA
jgi:hypothetical protein